MQCKVTLFMQTEGLPQPLGSSLKTRQAALCSSKRHPKHFCCFWMPLLPTGFCFGLVFLLSILSDFQTHHEVLISKPAVSSFGTDKIRLIRRGLFFWGKENTVLEYGQEQQGSGELFQNLSHLAKN